MTSGGQPLSGAVAVVTGASSGIGRAVAVSLTALGASSVLVGRRRDALEETARLCSGTPEIEMVDLADADAVRALGRRIVARHGRADVLVHAAAEIAVSDFAEARVEDFDRQYRVNLRAPFVLTQCLLAALRDTGGQVVFVNSSAGLDAPARAAQYAATKHGLRGLADALRKEVNPQVRIISVYPGTTATPMQERLHGEAEQPYDATRLLQPDDVASAVLAAVTAARTAELTDVVLRPFLPR